MSKRKDKKVMTVEMDEKLFEDFRKIANEKNVNRAALMRAAAEKFVKDNQ